MHRFSIIGCSGSGKSTLADSLQQKTGMAWLELDALHHQSDWTPLDTPEFRQRTLDFMARHPSWVMGGNYEAVTDLIRANCTDLVWLDLSLPRILSRLVVRSAHRSLTRTKLWNGNQERLRDLCSLAPERSMVSWTLKTHGRHQTRFETMCRDPKMEHVTSHRLRGTREVARWTDTFTQDFT